MQCCCGVIDVTARWLFQDGWRAGVSGGTFECGIYVYISMVLSSILCKRCSLQIQMLSSSPSVDLTGEGSSDGSGPPMTSREEELDIIWLCSEQTLIPRPFWNRIQSALRWQHLNGLCCVVLNKITRIRVHTGVFTLLIHVVYLEKLKFKWSKCRVRISWLWKMWK